MRIAFPIFLSILLLGVTAAVTNAFPVPKLPDDNLIVNPWFRSASAPSQPGFDGWTRPLNEGVTWGPSQKESNPSPDIVISGTCGFEEVYCGTAARWAEQSGVLYADTDVFMHQSVMADPAQRKLTFFAHWVSHRVDVANVNIYGSNAADGPWTLVWVPLNHSEDELIIPESRDSVELWEETGFLERTLEKGYPYYKVELHSRLPTSPIGIRGVGFKITGIYFSTAFTDEPGEPFATPAPPVGETVTNTETPEATAVAAAATPPTVPTAAPNRETNPAAGDVTGEAQPAMTLTADVLSPSEISLAWEASNNNGRGFRLERSQDGTTGWAAIATVEQGSGGYLDSGLRPDTLHYYRLRASQTESSEVISVRTPPLPEPTPDPSPSRDDSSEIAGAPVNETAEQPQDQPEPDRVDESPDREIGEGIENRDLAWPAVLAALALAFLAGLSIAVVLLRRARPHS